MRKLIIIMFMFCVNHLSFSQDLIRDYYLLVVERGFSSTPDYVVITIKNSNTGEIKEVCDNVSSLCLNLQKEYSQNDLSAIRDSLIAHSEERLFEISNNEVLESIGFKDYNDESLEIIDSIIQEENLLDSLSKFSDFRNQMIDYPEYYMDMRFKKAEVLRDSMLKQRELTPEENEILNHISDILYNLDYDHYYWDSLSKNGQDLISTWNYTISSDKDKYDAIGDELYRQENKFFAKYIMQYDSLFCHALFKYGVLCQNDENTGEIKLGQLINNR